MKRLPTLILIAIIFLISAVWLLVSKKEIKRINQETKVATKAKQYDILSKKVNKYNSEAILSKSRRNEELQFEKEAAQIRKDLLMAASNNDMKIFGSRMVDLLDRFKGDPSQILHDLSPLLEHENESIVGVVASAFLRSRINTENATAALLRILVRTEPLIEAKTEDDPVDIRLAAATILSEYPSEEISDAVWKLYERTKDKGLFDELFRLKNPNLPGEIIPLLTEHGAVFNYINIIAEYKIQDALEPLLKWYSNEYFMRKGDGPKRGATLWGLWRLTGEQKYHDEFIATGGGRSVEYLANEGTPEAKVRLLSLMQERTYSNMHDMIAMALHLKYADPPELKEYLRNIYLTQNTSSISVTLLYRLTAAIDDPELHALAAKAYPGAGGPGMWRQYGVYRKGWAIPEWAGGALDIR